MTQQPNLLFILTDQQSFSMMSCAGNPWLSTPAMDTLAAKGTLFERAYCCNPVCIPSRFSLFTGRFPSEIGQRSNNVKKEITAPLPEQIIQMGMGHVLKSAGYETVYGGKEHLPLTNAAELGFDCFCNDERESLADSCAHYLQQPHDKPFCMIASLINPHDICHMAISEYGKTLDLENASWDKTPEAAWIKAIIDHGDKEEACLKEAMRLPEGMAEQEFFENHCPPLPENHAVQENQPEAVDFIKDQRKFKRYAHDHFTDEQWRLHRWAYCRLTERVDAQIATILDALEKSGQQDNTVIIFSSDHGDMDAAHKMEHKTVLYEESTHIPFIVVDPTTANTCSHNSNLISNGLDILPTFCDYAGIPAPEDLHGKSVRPLLTEAYVTNWRETLPVESEFGRMIVTEDHKYMFYDTGANNEQLIDLKADPLEMRNAAGDVDKQAILTEHRQRFAQAFRKQ